MFQSGMVELADQSWWPRWLPANGMRELVPLLVIVLVLFFRGSRLPIRGSIIQRRQPLALATDRAWVGLGIGLVLVFVLSNLFTGEWEVALTTSLVAGMIMLSSVVLVGFLGQISLAQTALAGVAAYTAIRLASNGKLGPFDLVAVDGPGWPAPIAFLFGVAAAVVVGFLVGLPALRIRGVQLAIVTIAAVGVRSATSCSRTRASTRRRGPGHDAGAQAATGSASTSSATDPQTNQTDYWHFTVVRGDRVRRCSASPSSTSAAAPPGDASSRCGPTSGPPRPPASTSPARSCSASPSPRRSPASAASCRRTASAPCRSSPTASSPALAILAFAYLGGITVRLGRHHRRPDDRGRSGRPRSSATSPVTDFNAYLPIIGAIGLILTAILNPEGIATGTALTVKELWAKAEVDAPAAEPPETAPSEPTSAAGVSP